MYWTVINIPLSSNRVIEILRKYNVYVVCRANILQWLNRIVRFVIKFVLFVGNFIIRFLLFLCRNFLSL